jgi:hypothetical protein
LLFSIKSPIIDFPVAGHQRYHTGRGADKQMITLPARFKQANTDVRVFA